MSSRSVFPVARSMIIVLPAARTRSCFPSGRISAAMASSPRFAVHRDFFVRGSCSVNVSPSSWKTRGFPSAERTLPWRRARPASHWRPSPGRFGPGAPGLAGNSTRPAGSDRSCSASTSSRSRFSCWRSESTSLRSSPGGGGGSLAGQESSSARSAGGGGAGLLSPGLAGGAGGASAAGGAFPASGLSWAESPAAQGSTSAANDNSQT